MNCPKCARALADHALFCGYCGAPIEKHTRSHPAGKTADAMPQQTQDDLQKAGAEAQTPVPSLPEPVAQSPEKNRRGRKILLVFSLLAIIAGSMLGFIAARGIVDLRDLLPRASFAWTDRTEGISQTGETPDPVEDFKENAGDA